MGAIERLDKLIELQNENTGDYVKDFLKFCEEDLKREPKQKVEKIEKVERKPMTQDDVKWKLIDKRLARNGIRL